MKLPLKIGPAANRDPKLRILRKATTEASYRHGVGGREKKRQPKQITLAKVSNPQPPLARDE